jgi:hypothetical protein
MKLSKSSLEKYRDILPFTFRLHAQNFVGIELVTPKLEQKKKGEADELCYGHLGSSSSIESHTLLSISAVSLG